MKDSIGIELKPGDRVAYSGSYPSRLESGLVVGFTTKKIRIGFAHRYVTKFPEQVCKVETPTLFTDCQAATLTNLDEVVRNTLLEDGTYFIDIEALADRESSSNRSLLINVKDGIVKAQRRAERAHHFSEKVGQRSHITRHIHIYKLCKESQ